MKNYLFILLILTYGVNLLSQSIYEIDSSLQVIYNTRLELDSVEKELISMRNNLLIP